MVTTNSVTLTTAAAFIPDLWADGILAAAEFVAKLQDRVTRDYEGVIANMGGSVEVSRLSNLTTQTKSGGISNQISFEAITESKQTITIATHQYAAFLLEDVVDVQSKIDLRASYEKKIGYAIARGREIAVTALVASIGAPNIVGTLGSELSVDDWMQAYRYLGEAGLLGDDKTPSVDFTVALTYGAYVGAMKLDLFNNSLTNPKADVVDKAELINIMGIPVFLSNLLTADGGGHDCAMFHRGFAALAVQAEIPVRSQFVILNIADGIVGWNLYGSSILSYPPETPGGGTVVANRGVFLKSV